MTYLTPYQMKTQDARRLMAVMRALKNCHNALGRIEGGENTFLAKQGIEQAFTQTAILSKRLMRAMPDLEEQFIDVEMEEFTDGF